MVVILAFLMTNIDQIDLRNACIFDLTDDKRLIKKIVSSFRAGSKEEYLTGLSDNGRMFDMLEFAEVTGNKPLLKKLRRIFGYELSVIFNE